MGGFFLCHLDHRLGKSLLVHLSILVHRNLLDLHQRRRNHVRRFPLPDKLRNLLRFDGLIAYIVSRHRLPVGAQIPCHYRSVPDPRIVSHHGLHLGQLDPEAVYLHLAVPTTDELDFSVGTEANDITGAICLCILSAVIRVLDKYLRRLFRTVEISGTHVRSCHHQLTQSSRRKQMPKGIHYIKLHIRKCMSDGEIVLFLCHLVNGGQDGTLRRTIKIIEIKLLRRLHGYQLLTAHRQRPKVRISHFRCILASHLRGNKCQRHLIPDEIFVHGRHIQPLLLRYDHHCGTVGKRGIHVHHAGIETIGGILSHPVMLRKLIEISVPVNEADQIAVGQLYALGYAGASRSIQQDKCVPGSADSAGAGRIRRLFRCGLPGRLLIHCFDLT